MKHIFIILISTIVLQGCLSTFAGISAGMKVDNALNNAANKNMTEEEKLQQAQNKELRSCLAGKYRIECVDEMMLKECDVSLFKKATLYLKCDAGEEYDMLTLYVKGISSDDEQFEKVLNKVRSKHQQK